MSIRILFTPHDEAGALFSDVKEELLILSPNIKTGFIDFIDNICKKSGICPRVITTASSESGTMWDRDKSYSDYVALQQKIENEQWQVRVAKFNLRAYCIDHSKVIISTVNPSNDGRTAPGGLWIVFDDSFSCLSLIQEFEYYWNIAKDLRGSEITAVLQEKGQALGEFFRHAPDLPNSYQFILKEEFILQQKEAEYQEEPTDENLIKYLKALELFDQSGEKRISLAKKHLNNCGETETVLGYFAKLNWELSNRDEAKRIAYLALAKNKKNMDMIAILISCSSNVLFAKEFDPFLAEDITLIKAVAEVIESHLMSNEDKQLADLLQRIYRRIWESNRDPLIREKANRLVSKYGWHLGW